MSAAIDSYGPAYRHHASDAYSAVRREAYDEDLGQNSWLTGGELRTLVASLEIVAETRVLEVACGSGGPACHVARNTGCRLTGIDNSADGIASARTLAREMGVAERVRFVEADANEPLPLNDGAFDALLCIDALNHLRDRRFVFDEWRRVLRPGGAMTFTDPVVVTGAVTNVELALRSAIGFFLFTPPGYTEHLLEEAGLRLVRVSDASHAAATIAERRRAAREAHREALVAIEGIERFGAYQDFLGAVHELSASRRLSRLIYHAIKP